jgi:ATP adenylyltransferase
MTRPWIEQIATAQQHAMAQGAMVALQSVDHAVQQDGLDFLVSHLSSLSLKDLAKILQQGSGSNPFLPYEPAMFVADLSDSHVLLLNKFPIFPDHVMVVTRRFMPQTGELEAADFAALAEPMCGIDGAAFMFNGGKEAGASQPHRHLHVLPRHRLPLLPRFPAGAARSRCRRCPSSTSCTPTCRWMTSCRPAPGPGSCRTRCNWAWPIASWSPIWASCPLQPAGHTPRRAGGAATARALERWRRPPVRQRPELRRLGGVKGPEQIEPVSRAGLKATLAAVTQPRD